jgi:hypothetical protein
MDDRVPVSPLPLHVKPIHRKSGFDPFRGAFELASFRVWEGWTEAKIPMNTAKGPGIRSRFRIHDICSELP